MSKEKLIKQKRIGMKIDLKFVIPVLAVFSIVIANGAVSQLSANQSETVKNAVNTSIEESAANQRIINWAKGYSLTSNSSVAKGVIQMSDGGYLVGGDCYSGSCASVMKLDPKGIIKWQKKYAFSGSAPSLTVIQQTSDNGSIFAGQNTICKRQSYCTSIIKVDSNGNIQWESDLLSQATTIPHSIQQTSDGGYVVAGYIHGSRGNYSTWVAKLNSTGNIQWQKFFINSVNGATAIRQTPDNGYVIAGFTLANNMYHILVVKLDSSGSIIWQKIYSTNYGTFANSLELTSDGGYIVGGEVYTTSYFPAIVLKLDSKGNTQWANTYTDKGAGIQLNSIIKTVDGGYALAGFIYNGAEKAWIGKIDLNGNIKWQKTYGAATANRIFMTINQTNDGGFVASGATDQFNGKFDAWIVKVDPNGNIAGCTDIQTALVIGSSVSVAVASGGLITSNNGFVYGTNTLASFSDSYFPIKEC